MTDCETCKYALILEICNTTETIRMETTRIMCLFYGSYVILDKDEVCTHYEEIE